MKVACELVGSSSSPGSVGGEAIVLEGVNHEPAQGAVGRLAKGSCNLCSRQGNTLLWKDQVRIGLVKKLIDNFLC